MIDHSALQARLTVVRERIAAAAGRAGRDPASIRLVAVSKTFPAEFVRAACAAGQTDFGENKVQEALQKMDACADLPIRWHLVGHLQSNKVRKAGRFDAIHSVDRAGTVTALDAVAREGGRRIDLLVQVDLAHEATKHGAAEADLAAIFDAARGTEYVRIRGLMLLPPFVDDPEAGREHFRGLRGVRDRLLDTGVDPSMLGELSMGMSHDFEVAIEEGATIVRVGTAIFGTRTARA